MRAWIVAALPFVGSLPAQAALIELPVLLRLGTVPARLPAVDVPAAGTAGVTIPAGAGELAVRADKAAPMSALQHVLDAARANGAERVFLLAALRDGTPGALALALPAADDVSTPVVLRAHRERPGVPPESVVPLLRRLREGGERSGHEPFALALELPADASCAQFLALLGAAVDGGAAWPAAPGRTAVATTARTALALSVYRRAVRMVR